MKEVIQNSEVICSTLRRKIAINKNAIFEEKWIVNPFDNFFINIGPKVTVGIPTTTRSFESYVQKTNKTIKGEPITINGLKDAIFPLKINKSGEYDKISFNIIKICFGELNDPLKYIFNLSFKKVFSQTIWTLHRHGRFLKGATVQILVITGQYLSFHVFLKVLND